MPLRLLCKIIYLLAAFRILSFNRSEPERSMVICSVFMVPVIVLSAIVFSFLIGPLVRSSIIAFCIVSRLISERHTFSIEIWKFEISYCTSLAYCSTHPFMLVLADPSYKCCVAQSREYGTNDSYVKLDDAEHNC